MHCFEYGFIPKMQILVHVERINVSGFTKFVISKATIHGLMIPRGPAGSMVR
jgi:hypothetical protein